MRSRRVCKKTIDAAKETAVPLGESNVRDDYFKLDSIGKYNALLVMAETLPGLRQISINSQSYDSLYKNKDGKFKYNDGKNPDAKEVTRTADYITLDIVDALSKYPNLHALNIDRAPFNGQYPSLFSFSRLEKLSIICSKIKFDLEMLAQLPSLKDFQSEFGVTGSLKSLSVCKNTLETIVIGDGDVPISGNFMELANFPRLKKLDLWRAKEISGNLCDIDVDNENHFPVLESLRLPSQIKGGRWYEVMRVADAKQLIKDLTPLRRKRPELFQDDDAFPLPLYWKLSQTSPDVVNPNPDAWDFGDQYRTFGFYFVQDGSCLGWRWEEKYDYTPDHPFEVHWLDPVSDEVASKWVPSGLGRFFKGYYEPPPYNVLSRLARNYVPCAEELEIWENL